ncbi:uncharacterized protein LOC119666101 [Teleopsis dalmanni]|uniref:uncharacterized protein LOC119666101 n=1 Tax=Teleopsis dalmanni TaxID=139649 RepID=UPI0018CFD3C1|nr:uncharacterized protein LOC119666101 [Teleopsis dalmanni]
MTEAKESVADDTVEDNSTTNALNAIMKKLERIENMCLENRAEIATVKNCHVDDEKENSVVCNSAKMEIIEQESSVEIAERSQKKIIYDLPHFDGQPQEWPLFYANYNDTTKMFNYSNRENLMRLQKCLAREAVVSMLIYPADVPNAIEELEFRFGRPDLIVKDQLAKLQELPSFGESKLEQIVPFSTKIRNTVSVLKAANCSHYLCDITIMEALVRKIPPSKQYEWVLHSKSLKSHPTIENFSDWLGSISRVVCLLPTVSPKSSQSKASMVMHVNENNTPPLKTGCPNCKGQHNLFQCQSYQTSSVAERWNKVKNLKVCFSCLNNGHITMNCRSKKYCGINGCKRQHHFSLHEEKKPIASPAEIALNSTVLSCQTSSPAHLFKILPVTLCGPKGHYTTYAILDEGSSISIVEERVAVALGLKGQLQPLTLQWFGEKVATENCRKVDLDIVGSDRSKVFTLKNVNTIRNLGLPVQTFVKAKYPHLRDIPIAEYQCVKPTVLIGVDNAYLGVPSEVMQCNNPIAIKTKLGWVAYGPREDNANISPIVLHIRNEGIDEDLGHLIEEYFETENFGMNNTQQLLESEDNRRARSILEATTRKIDSCYETGLLWKTSAPSLPDSLEMASRRFKSIEKKMNGCSQFAQQYRTEMNNYFAKGYARILTNDEVRNCRFPVWYLPHFAVKNVHKPEKCRIVFDAAAIANGISLNSQLLKGPERAKPLLDILFKFRQGEIGVAADIKEMFSQVKIRVEDQHAQRFLWRIKAEVHQCVMTSMIFGAICSPCCAEYIKNKNAENFHEEYPEAVDIIINQHYVDDLVCGFSSADDAIKICQQVVNIHRQAGFELRNFVSNSKYVEQTMNSNFNEITSHIVRMEPSSSIEKILGMQWNTQQDVFEYHTKFHRVPNDVLKGIRPPTKRELLSITMAVFDPYGFIADFLLQPKLLMQQVWKCQVAWDELIPDPIVELWQAWWSEFEKLKQLKIDRCYSRYIAIASRIELHVMVDASETAFAAAAYFRIINREEIKISFILGKTRTAPKRLMSIPRLELQAAVLGLRISKTILKGHSIHVTKVTYWTDSRTVLHWIHASERKYKPFVGHRIAEIIGYSQPEQWRWVPTNENTADAATRLWTKFKPNGRWLCGPEFLKKHESEWPCYSIKLPNPIEEEICSLFLTRTRDCVINFNKFSSYSKLKRHMAWVLRAIKKLAQHWLLTLKLKKPSLISENCAPKLSRFRQVMPKEKLPFLSLTVDELRKAELKIIQIVQKENFANEIDQLHKGKHIQKSSSIYKLQPYLDEHELLRLHGRLDEATCLPLDARRPILTPQPYDKKMCLNKQWRIAQNLKNRMWKQWVIQYLPQLWHRPKWYSKAHVLQVDDLVIVSDPALPRSQWQKGRITQVFPAKDGQVRIAEVKTAAGLVRRPATDCRRKLCKIDLDLRGGMLRIRLH